MSRNGTTVCRSRQLFALKLLEGRDELPDGAFQLLDANVLISAAIRPSGPPGQIVTVCSANILSPRPLPAEPIEAYAVTGASTTRA